MTEATGAIEFVAQAMSNANATSHSVVVPAAVVAGDGLLLFFGTNTTATISEPTGVTGWQPLDTLVDVRCHDSRVAEGRRADRCR